MLRLIVFLFASTFFFSTTVAQTATTLVPFRCNPQPDGDEYSYNDPPELFGFAVLGNPKPIISCQYHEVSMFEGGVA
ncbi:MAG: hypothetical protein NZ108_06915, partial [Bacteroidia bacterium]|nr:hypothetical protein [Bacteroidia bacterium]